MSNTFFTEPPHWQWYIIFYFFIGGIAGVGFLLSALLQLFGRPADRPLVRLGYYVSLVGVAISGLLLTIDLGVPLRFWHMLVESETGQPMFKYWSPMSTGSWALLLFGLFTFLATLGALHDAGQLRWPALRPLARRPLATVVAVVGSALGLFIAGYTGVLLSVTNRPVWADSTWLGILFLFSAGSSAAAALILLARWARVGHAPGTLDWLSGFDKRVLVLELIALVIFLVTLGSAARVFLSMWGVLLVVGVIGLGILLPLAIGFGKLPNVRNKLATTATLVLVGGFILRVATILSSEQVHVVGAQVITP